MNKKSLLAKLGVATMGLMLSASALASGTGNANDPFLDFKNMVMDWAQGPLGTGLAITMMLMGAGMGVARNSPMPALSGVAGAAFLNWGPGIIESLTTGALI